MHLYILPTYIYIYIYLHDITYLNIAYSISASMSRRHKSGLKCASFDCTYSAKTPCNPMDFLHPAGLLHLGMH